ncbi:hypothetical protein BDW59DRAFT_179340 [Aspergillus cavernicola]|uniref:ER-bound oxygenase mpaB/mpaB'/Rubber oxygenase catalytic domain-containing protein n=1 Tax=Aspergillus cavernicola TaxID=176166 RepID=A0ABR4IGC0_9EURO
MIRTMEMEFLQSNPIFYEPRPRSGSDVLTVRRHRFNRRSAITSRFANRPLSSMTVSEAHTILRELRELEFPYSMHNAMKLSHLNMHLLGIARMNYLHARYRRPGRFSTRMSSAYAWVCGVPKGGGWMVDGGCFAEELVRWTLEYESEKAKPTELNRVIGRSLMDLGTWRVPGGLKPVAERVIGTMLDAHMRVSMGFPEPGLVIETLMKVIVTTRKFILRYLTLPRSESRAVRVLEEHPDPVSGLYTINLWIVEPWYIKPTFKNRWGVKALLARLFGNGAVPTVNGSYREEGYDLRTIGPAAQEKRGLDESEKIYEESKGRQYAAGCPFHC